MTLNSRTHAQQGDFRNWPAIRDWAANLRPALLAA